MPTGRRLVFRIAFCLALGVVTTVAVAWGLAYFVCPDLWAGNVHDSVGWPVQALSRDFEFGVVSRPTRVMRAENTVPAGFMIQVFSGIYFADRESFPVVLPVHPVYAPFLASASFYGVIWFSIFVGFGRFKRWNRTRRGLCPMCKYDLRGNRSPSPPGEGVRAGCPECGWGREGVG